MSKRQPPPAKWIPVVVICQHPLLGSVMYPFTIHYRRLTAAYVESGKIDDLAQQVTANHSREDVEAIFATGEWSEWKPWMWGSAAKHRKCSTDKLFPRKKS